MPCTTRKKRKQELGVVAVWSLVEGLSAVWAIQYYVLDTILGFALFEARSSLEKLWALQFCEDHLYRREHIGPWVSDEIDIKTWI